MMYKLSRRDFDAMCADFPDLRASVELMSSRRQQRGLAGLRESDRSPDRDDRPDRSRDVTAGAGASAGEGVYPGSSVDSQGGGGGGGGAGERVAGGDAVRARWSSPLGGRAFRWTSSQYVFGEGLDGLVAAGGDGALEGALVHPGSSALEDSSGGGAGGGVLPGSV